MFRSMHVDRRKVHDLFQKQQGILLCAASEGYDHRYISTIAVTGITDKWPFSQTAFVSCSLWQMLQVFTELSTLYVTGAPQIRQPEKCSVSPQQQELFVLSIKISISQQYHR